MGSTMTAVDEEAAADGESPQPPPPPVLLFTPIYVSVNNLFLQRTSKFKIDFCMNISKQFFFKTLPRPLNHSPPIFLKRKNEL